jgi:hypothetical protein
MVRYLVTMARSETLFRAQTLGAIMDEDEEGEDDGGLISPRGKALGVALLVDLLCLPLSLIMFLVWPVVILAIVPYVGGALGGRYVDRRTGMLMGALAAAIMTTVLVSIFLYILIIFPGEGFNFWDSLGLSIVAGAYVIAMLFGAMGGRHGSMAAEKD